MAAEDYIPIGMYDDEDYCRDQGQEPVVLDVKLLGNSKKAWKVEYKGKTVWVGKSISILKDNVLTVPNWVYVSSFR